MEDLVQRAFRAAWAGDAPTLALCLAQGADPNAKLAGEPLLVAAAFDAKIECLKILIEAGARLGDTDRHGLTPSMRAASMGQALALEALLEGGADPETRDAKGKTAVALAVEAGSPQKVACLEALARRGADLNAQDKVGWTPMMRAASGDRRDALSALLALGADMERKTLSGMTAAGLAALQGQGEALRALIMAGADVLGGSRGRSVLDCAKNGGHHHCVALAEAALIGAGAGPSHAETSPRRV